MKVRRFLAILCLVTFMQLISGCWEDPYAEPPLHEAAMEGDLHEVKELLNSGVGVNSKSNTGSTALHWAAFKGHYDVALYLIKNGADVNALTNKGSTPLRLATTHKKTKLIKLLKQYGGR